MLSKKNVVKVNGIYVSLLYKDWFAAEYIVNISDIILQVRMPYKTREKAERMIEYLNGKRPGAPAPDWRPIVKFMAKAEHTK